jgi:uncharacterized C2H2 Zn-finger protein
LKIERKIEPEKVPVIPGEKYVFKDEYKCPYCGEIFESHYLMEKHINLIHPIEQKENPIRDV